MSDNAMLPHALSHDGATYVVSFKLTGINGVPRSTSVMMVLSPSWVPSERKTLLIYPITPF
jgi:hypothetical protein